MTRFSDAEKAAKATVRAIKRIEGAKGPCPDCGRDHRFEVLGFVVPRDFFSEYEPEKPIVYEENDDWKKHRMVKR